ncbi:hypothetical protein BYT27DRAFT_7184144 [Phlegmacium glaucopus]|nr:hypothetical protein BYT27DRAFT_7184144 [Phlegmacium glaucopus]
MIPANNSLFPALYLYPLNDTWHPKHISLTSQRTKIGRQTSSKTAPGERNGFFDSKVLSRQHAEVWEEGGKIYIKDVKSSNGTFINGERLSSEGHESEPFELKSDDIVEFGIDIVGEDNKTIIHHKVAARVVCVFSEQDAQVAARAEAHQQQQQQQVLHQQQQYMQQAHAAAAAAAGGQGSMTHAGPSSINVGSGVPQGQPTSAGVSASPYPPFSVQRRAQLAQQGLGGMGGMRPPGKTGLSFDVILSRLQGELQKSKQTGHELDTLTGAMHVIQDTLGGSSPGPLPPFPSNLPPVRPPQEATQPPAVATTDVAAAPIATAPPSAAASPEQPSAAPSAAASAAAVTDLQSQLRDTQSSLASHLDKVRALEGVLAEQEAMKREVRTLREMMEERRLEREREENALLAHQHPHTHEPEEPRGGFDMEEDEDDREMIDDDSDDDAHSITTVVPHELERVEEEDEDQMAEEERRGREDKLLEGEKHEEEDLLESEEEERERRREDLGLGRPRTPEPTRLGLDYPSLLSNAPRRAPITSSLSQPVSSSEDLYDQVQKLSKQVSTVMALTTTLEAQHSAAQTTIQVLESKVEALEGMLKVAEEALKVKTVQEEEAKEIAAQEVKVKEEEKKHEKESLTEMLAEWKQSVEGQWSHVQEEWKEERERLNKAREEWEAKLGAALIATAANDSTNTDGPSSEEWEAKLGAAPIATDTNNDTDTDGSSSSLLVGNVTTDGTKTIAAIAAAAGLTAAAVSANGINVQVHKAARTLPTPEPSVYKLSMSMNDRSPDLVSRTTTADDGSDLEQMSQSSSTSSSTSHPKNFVASANLEDLLWRFLLIFFPNLQSQQQYPPSESTATASVPSLNFHAAVGVLVLSVAAAAVFWKVKPE